MFINSEIQFNGEISLHGKFVDVLPILIYHTQIQRWFWSAQRSRRYLSINSQLQRWLWSARRSRRCSFNLMMSINSHIQSILFANSLSTAEPKSLISLLSSSGEPHGQSCLDFMRLPLIPKCLCMNKRKHYHSFHPWAANHDQLRCDRTLHSVPNSRICPPSPTSVVTHSSIRL